MSALTTGRCLREQAQRAVICRLEVTKGVDGHTLRRTMPDHTIEATVELWIDADSIMRQLGERAVRAKGKKAQAMAGAIVVRAVNHRRV